MLTTEMLWWGLLLLLLSFFLLCQLSPAFKYYVKNVYIYTVLTTVASWTVLRSVFYVGLKAHRDSALFTARALAPFSFPMGVTWRVEKSQSFLHMRNETAFVVVCNHQSVLDVFMMLHIWPILGHTVSVVKKELFWTGPFGGSLYVCGHVFIDRSTSVKGRKTINDAGAMCKEKKINMWVFPEGTRNYSKDGSLLPFKKGAFHVALTAGLPILPIVVSEYDFVDHKKPAFESGSPIISMLDPVSIEGFDDAQKLSDHVRKIMIDELQRLSTKKGQ